LKIPWSATTLDLRQQALTTARRRGAFVENVVSFLAPYLLNTALDRYENGILS
jgi:hypothetical protein